MKLKRRDLLKSCLLAPFLGLFRKKDIPSPSGDISSPSSSSSSEPKKFSTEDYGGLNFKNGWEDSPWTNVKTKSQLYDPTYIWAKNTAEAMGRNIDDMIVECL